ncbi:cytochrome c biogenesis protein [Actomonas aquatica]|uniref:Cytochrome c biogenesis protein CcsA n=1 Tax=Actomonas aquatica TaxID=2866162 RepID=A0ABZ1C3S7_9BACT|nr:cytochrome c biogenesis protein CcsA [Opitutus sp. WL0086]WRQ86351.1 cytochrome c biogenesis protein CcsA [Opitutus sp. WL0086]
MTWQLFPWIVGGAGTLWLGGFTIGRQKPWPWVLAGTALVIAFLSGLWLHLGRPPLRTLGETRLWFGALLPLCGLAIYMLVRWRWPLAYAVGIATLFLTITALRPETHDRTLMPALQSPFFVPHVVLYLLAYAFLTYAAALAAWAWWQGRRDDDSARQRCRRTLGLAEVGLWLGFSFLSLGLLAGAVWAKEAWGHYWTWDPKETWAFLTWAVYLGYLHLRSEWQARPRRAAAYLALASAVVMVCWFGVNYLPSAQQSVHTYAG